MGIANTGSLYFGPADGSRFYSYTPAAMPRTGGDWCIVWIGVRFHHLTDPAGGTSSSNIQYIDRTASFGGGTGGNDGFLRIFPDNYNISGKRKCIEFKMKRSGSGFLASGNDDSLLSTTPIARNTPYVFVAQRNGSTIELWQCAANGTAVMVASGAISSVFASGTDLTFGTWETGAGGFVNYHQAKLTAKQSLSKANIESIAAGTDPETIVSTVGNRLGAWKFDSAASTISDSWGAATATRNGTWANQPACSPTLNQQSTYITLVEPIPYQPLGTPNGGGAKSKVFTGTYAGFTPATFQYKILLNSDQSLVQDWTSMTSFTASTGSWSGTTSLPVGGPYSLLIRDSGDNTKVWNGGNPWLVCPTLLTMGQSPMVQLTDTFIATTTFTSGAKIYVTFGTDSEIVPATSALTGSGLVTAMNRYHSVTSGNPLCVLKGAISGPSSTQWADPAGSQFVAMLAIADAAKADNVLCLWLNGAADVGINSTTIKSNHDTIFANLGTYLTTNRSCGFRYEVIPHNRDTAGSSAEYVVRVAQYEWVTAHASYGTNVLLGPPWTDMQTVNESTGTSTAGTANTITLSTSEPAQASSDHDGSTITITSGMGSGQTRTWSAYNAATRVYTVTVNWVTNPDATSVYKIVGTHSHPTNANGAQRYGARWGQDIAYNFGYTATTGKGPTISRVEYPHGGDGSIIDVTVAHTSGTNLQTPNGGTSASSVHGFDVSEDAFSNSKTISSAVISSANQVRLTLSAPPSVKANLVVRYLYAEPVSPANFLRIDDTLYDDSSVSSRGLPLWFTPANLAVTEVPTYSISGGSATVASGGTTSAFTATLSTPASGTDAFILIVTNGTGNITAVGGSITSNNSAGPTVRPVAGATTFTFTITSTNTSNITLAYVNGSGWTDPANTSITVASATLTQDGQTKAVGFTLTGTYTGFTPNECFVGIIDGVGFTANAGTWSASIPLNAAIGSGQQVILQDANSLQVVAGSITVIAASTARRSKSNISIHI